MPFVTVQRLACGRPDGHRAGLGPKVPLPSGPHQCRAHPGEAAPCLRPEEEAWLDVHLDELVAKGVIGPILPGEQPRCVTPLLLVPGVQSGQPYRVCQNIVPVNKRTAEY